MAEEATQQYEYATERYETARDAAAYWAAEITAASDQEKRWREDAKDAAKEYDAGDSGNSSIRMSESSFNILHSNVETMVPSLYNSTPVPDARPRNNREDDVARKAGSLIEGALAYQVDSQDFDEKILDAIYDAEIAGRGVLRVRYNPIMAPAPDMETGEIIAFEETTIECVPWEKFRRGPADSWEGIPWIAFEHSMSRDELVELIVNSPEGTPEYDAEKKLADVIPLDETTTEDKDGKREGVFKRAKVWEIWDKETRTVIYFAPSYEESLLAVVDDVLQLREFWPVPRPLMKKRRGKDRMTPICPYNVYKAQAQELERISARILKLTEAMKWRGIRASEIKEMERVAVAEDGEFVPSQEAMALLQHGGAGLDKAIWVMPLDMLSKVLQELYQMREMGKQAIYEVTGISDVVRGSTNPNETATAQGIKAQWGSLRLQKQQREVQRFVRDTFGIMAEIIANKFQPDTLQMMSGEEVTPEEIALLRSDVQRHFRVDIETDSTISGDVARMQQNMNGFMQGTAQFIQAVMPGVQSGMLPPAAAAEIFSAFAGTFRLGRRVEDVLSGVVEAAENMPPPGQPTPEQQQQQQQMQQMQQVAMAKEVSETKENEAQAAKYMAEAQQTAVETELAPVEAQIRQFPVQ